MQENTADPAEGVLLGIEEDKNMVVVLSKKEKACVIQQKKWLWLLLSSLLSMYFTDPPTLTLDRVKKSNIISR